MKKIFLAIVIYAAFINSSFAQQQTAQEYIDKYKDLAMREMRREGVPAAITLAQGLLETENGNSELFKNSNNHFGIKCKSDWTAESYNHDDDLKGECFRVYKNAEASYRDHSDFLRSRSWYAFLFKLDPLDYKGWAYGLKKAGYATNPKYPNVLIHNIETYNLQQYSVTALNDTTPFVDDVVDTTIDTTMMDVPDPIEASSTAKLVVNGSKCIYEAKGTSLLAIAIEHNINLNDLLEYNDLTQDGLLDKDQNIFLEKKSKTGANPYCTFIAGETLYDIAQQEGVQLHYLLAYNELREGDHITAGTKIYLQPRIMQNPVPVPIIPVPPAATVQPTTKTYKVLAGEGIYTVARKNGVTMQQIRDLNHMANDSLFAGQQLIIAQ